jgi:hypothetical protein
VGRTARRPIKKQLFATKMVKTRLQWAKKCNNVTRGDCKKAVFTDGTHFFVQVHRKTAVQKSQAEPLRTKTSSADSKPSQQKMFWGSFTSTGPESLSSIGLINSEKDSYIMKRGVFSSYRELPKR